MSTARASTGEVRERVLEAAEALFAEHGFDAVSFRDLTGRAGVSLSAVHYHFGSKEALLGEVFARSARPITERRLHLLDQVGLGADGRPSLERVLEAFLRPAFEVTGNDRANRFNRLRARVAFETTATARRILGAAFDECDNRFIAMLSAAVPGLSRREVLWRFHFLVGAMIYTMADPGQLEGLSDGLCSPADVEEVSRRMVPYLAAAFRAPEPGFGPSTWLSAPASAQPMDTTRRRARAG
jgi:AcrR family transcriptional regulator